MTAPESVSQAQAWDRMKRNALDYGLCITDASQIAWGHQNGFWSVPPPCPECRPLVDALPKEKLNGWRTVAGAATDPKNWPPPIARAPSVSLGARVANATPAGAGARDLRRSSAVDRLRERDA